ncbi:PAAR domain-containing protein [Paraburkholderia sp. BCC1876]|uniref:PAAR domain-containing protein n=1 Tax=Paraburkholderia sp. BCC1876 TaxID=2676303 RepID=UPI00159176E5|nr:PAAR domain-containing protein [Paraburkholderia sp. BCC1876]
MSRRFILKGDKTDHDGVVEEGIEGTSFQGRPMAYIGAQVHCPRCGTTGVIVSDGASRDMTVMGKQVALEKDLCQCQCDPLPRLVASQTPGAISS